MTNFAQRGWLASCSRKANSTLTLPVGMSQTAIGVPSFTQHSIFIEQNHLSKHRVANIFLTSGWGGGRICQQLHQVVGMICVFLRVRAWEETCRRHFCTFRTMQILNNLSSTFPEGFLVWGWQKVRDTHSEIQFGFSNAWWCRKCRLWTCLGTGHLGELAWGRGEWRIKTSHRRYFHNDYIFISLAWEIELHVCGVRPHCKNCHRLLSSFLFLVWLKTFKRMACSFRG